MVANADDVLLFLTNPFATLPNLLQEIKVYGEVSNFKVSLSKSCALNASLPQTLVTQRCDNFLLIWHGRSITYIDIQLPTNLLDLETLNYMPLLNSYQQDIQA